jgi:hypothetical protein
LRRILYPNEKRLSRVASGTATRPLRLRSTAFEDRHLRWLEDRPSALRQLPPASSAAYLKGEARSSNHAAGMMVLKPAAPAIRDFCGIF